MVAKSPRSLPLGFLKRLVCYLALGACSGVRNVGKALESGSGDDCVQPLNAPAVECGFSDLCLIPLVAEAWGRRAIFSVHACLHLPLLNIYRLEMAPGKDPCLTD